MIVRIEKGAYVAPAVEEVTVLEMSSVVMETSENKGGNVTSEEEEIF